MRQNGVSAARTVKNTLIVLAILMLIGSAVYAQGEGGRRALGFLDIWLLPRVWMSAIFSLLGLGLLMKSWVSRNLRSVLLALVFFVFGVVSILPLGTFASGMSPHPSPVCTVTRPFQFMNAGRAVPVMFLAVLASISILSVIGNKLFCGWVCPIGAIQEICHRIRLSKKPKIKLPFKATNLVRIGIFAVFLIVVFSAGRSIYDYFNPFELLHWGFEISVIVVLFATIVASVFIFRPFCYLVCPLGLFTWILEHIALVRVKVDKQACTDCNVCIKLSPCPAVPSILEERSSRPDCHACGRCLEVCPENALAFRMRGDARE